MDKVKSWLTPTAAAPIVGRSAATLRRVCKRYPGFATNINGSYLIASDHINRLLRGDTVEQIARDVRSIGEGKAA